MKSPGSLAVRGILGTLVIVLVVLASLNLNKLPLIGNNDVIHLEFAEAGGLKAGDVVLVSGAQVGKIRSIRIEGTHVVADAVITDSKLRLGDETTAAIITITLLGRAGVQLVPAGTGDLEAGDTIPVERTSSPYDITSALNELTVKTSAIDKSQLTAALRQLSTTLDTSQSSVGPALRGIVSLSSAISSNDANLRSLLGHANRVTAVLASRNKEITPLLTSGRSLLAELTARQSVVVALLRDGRRLANQLHLVLAENDGRLGPALDELDKVLGVLNRNRKNLQATITGLRGYATAFGEAIGSGPWFDAYVQNLTSPGTLAPIISGVTQ
ncbi:MAG TPA: MCE family protein [Nocardioides sp.]|nr:MCE family protein [Nocardioides sp.]